MAFASTAAFRSRNMPVATISALACAMCLQYALRRQSSIRFGAANLKVSTAKRDGVGCSFGTAELFSAIPGVFVWLFDLNTTKSKALAAWDRTFSIAAKLFRLCTRRFISPLPPPQILNFTVWRMGKGELLVHRRNISRRTRSWPPLSSFLNMVTTRCCHRRLPVLLFVDVYCT